MSKARPGVARRLLRPVAGWRAFFDEILIVVAGVFLALAAQQWVEDRRLNKRLQFTEDALALEISPSLYAAHERVAIDPCLKNQLTGIYRQIARGSDTWKARPMAPVGPGGDGIVPAYGSPVRLWPTSSWDTATAGDALATMPDDRLNAYSKVFAMIGLIRQAQQAELALAPRIAHLALDGRLDPAMRAEAINNLSALYQNRFLMRTSSEQLIGMIAELDLPMEPGREVSMNKQLAKIRQFFGRCAVPYTIRL